MRELKRSSKIVEQLKIGDKIIEINLSTTDLVTRFRKTQLDILHAEKEIKELQTKGIDSDNMTEAFEAYGNAIVRLFELIFGDENSQIILEFYENNYEEMALEVTPFINEVIVPKIQEVYQEQKSKLKVKYNNKRSLFR